MPIALRLSACLVLALSLPACGPKCQQGEDTTIDLDQNGVADCAETLVKNSQLVGGIAGWTAGMEATVMASTMDAKTAAGSSALQVQNVASSMAPTIRGARQCVALSPNSRYVVAGQYYIPAQTGGLGAQIQVRHFTQPDCAGGELNAQVTTIDMTAGSWGTLKTEITAPGANSAYYEPSVRKTPTSLDPSLVLFDNLLIHAL